ncbi:MAG TPA: two-component system response regulator [Nitrospiraceae bacterium]|jgi:two-component system chemotaxis response regulator CheY|nr:two-component system response regulator [Nitrospiraceae bacterium]
MTPAQHRGVLIVEDSISIRQAVSFAVKDAGYDVIEADGGKEALRKLNDAGIDIVIADLDMKEIDGIEFIRQVRNTLRHRFTPIVVLMTDSQESERQKGKQAGANGWVIKPFRPDQLQDVVKRFIRQRPV